MFSLINPFNNFFPRRGTEGREDRKGVEKEEGKTGREWGRRKGVGINQENYLSFFLFQGNHEGCFIIENGFGRRRGRRGGGRGLRILFQWKMDFPNERLVGRKGRKDSE